MPSLAAEDIYDLLSCLLVWRRFRVAVRADPKELVASWMEFYYYQGDVSISFLTWVLVMERLSLLSVSYFLNPNKVALRFAQVGHKIPSPYAFLISTLSRQISGRSANWLVWFCRLVNGRSTGWVRRRIAWWFISIDILFIQLLYK